MNKSDIAFSIILTILTIYFAITISWWFLILLPIDILSFYRVYKRK